jgi:hypothetical protein
MRDVCSTLFFCGYAGELGLMPNEENGRVCSADFAIFRRYCVHQSCIFGRSAAICRNVGDLSHGKVGNCVRTPKVRVHSRSVLGLRSIVGCTKFIRNHETCHILNILYICRHIQTSAIHI